jgi:hypothetical protein
MVDNNLVGGAIINHLEKSWSSSMGRKDDIPLWLLWKIIHSCLKPPTRNGGCEKKPRLIPGGYAEGWFQCLDSLGFAWMMIDNPQYTCEQHV